MLNLIYLKAFIMKNIFLGIILSLFICSCSSNKTAKHGKDSHQPAKVEKGDDGEWELTVFDAGYESFLATTARPRSLYTETFLKSRNQLLVNEWNALYYSGRYRNIVESDIDYDPNEKYGLEFEYRLYQVFAYTSWKYRIRFDGLSSADRFR